MEAERRGGKGGRKLSEMEEKGERGGATEEEVEEEEEEEGWSEQYRTRQTGVFVSRKWGRRVEGGEKKGSV